LEVKTMDLQKLAQEIHGATMAIFDTVNAMKNPQLAWAYLKGIRDHLIERQSAVKGLAKRQGLKKRKPKQ